MRRIEAGQPLPSTGAYILGPGVHQLPLLTGGVQIKGEEGAVLDGDGGTILELLEDGLSVQIEDVELRGGKGEAAGGVVLRGLSRVLLRRCLVRGCVSRRGGVAGGVYAARGTLILEDCRFEENLGTTASDLVATGIAEVSLRDCTLGGDVALREGATLTLENSTVEGTLSARGTTTRAPTLHLQDSLILGGLRNDPALPATLHQTEKMLPS
ncbi:MAG TPA: right-handed parallel beta-helix repeat-containing protein [Myxococcota bacterium]|nr:right-handed parallel beta-helix repeat-containing protein [Myxococcota bacterium]